MADKCLIIWFLVVCNIGYGYGGSVTTNEPVTKINDKPTFSTKGSLINCARMCTGIPECAVFIYGKILPKYDCGYGTDPKKAKSVSGADTIVFTRELNTADKIIPKSASYVQLDNKQRTLDLRVDDSFIVLVGNPDAKSLLKISASIKCENCNDNDVVSIYNVRDKTDDPIRPNDQSEGAALCLKPTPTERTTVFLSAKDSYALIRVGKSPSSKVTVELKLSKENWDTPYNCKDCTDLNTLPNLCVPPAAAVFKEYMPFHTFQITTVQPKTTIDGDGGTDSSKLPSLPTATDITDGSTTLSEEPTSSTGKDQPTAALPTTPEHQPNTTIDGDGNNNSNKIPSISTATDDGSQKDSTSTSAEPATSDGKDQPTVTKSESTDHTSSNDTLPKIRNGHSSSNESTTKNPKRPRSKDDNSNNNGNEGAQQAADGGVSNAAVTGGAIGGVLAGLAVAGAIVAGLLYRRHKRNKVEPSKTEINLEDNTTGSSPPCLHDSKALVVNQSETLPVSSSPPPPAPTSPTPSSKALLVSSTPPPASSPTPVEATVKTK